MKMLHVIQHTSADYLGLMEDHLEGRRIRFRYFRPFTEGTPMPEKSALMDGLVLLGGGPWGTAGTRDIPTLQSEIALTRAYLMTGRPIIGIGLGAQILSIAAEGKSEPAPLELSVGTASRIRDDALGGFMPEQWPNVIYMRDRPVPPAYATILANDEKGRVAAFQIGENVLGFTGHPGFKRAMAEDLIMEFEEAPENPGPALDLLSGMNRSISDALVPLMTGIIRQTKWMQV